MLLLECYPIQYKCGNVCVQKRSSCSSGNVTLGNKYSSEYCCLEPGDNCTYDYIDSEGNAVNPICSIGQPVPRTQTCQGECPDDGPSNSTDAQGDTTCDCPDKDGWKKCGDGDTCRYNTHFCTQLPNNYPNTTQILPNSYLTAT